MTYSHELKIYGYNVYFEFRLNPRNENLELVFWRTGLDIPDEDTSSDIEDKINMWLDHPDNIGQYRDRNKYA